MMPRLVPSFSTTFSLTAALLLGLICTTSCGRATDQWLCETDGCTFSKDEWARARALANLPDPPRDTSNRFIGDPAAIELGHRLYYDRDLSGESTWIDMVGRPTTTARSARGARTGLSCATCHDPAHGGGETTAAPANISVGAGWYDVNGQQTVNAAHYPLLYWNGRSDSLWGQAAAVMESDVSMNGTRLAIVWAVREKYGDAYNRLQESFLARKPAGASEASYAPLPMTARRAGVVTALGGATAPEDGPCPGTPASGCPEGCRAVTFDDGAAGEGACFPRFPLRGKPGAAGCQRRASATATYPNDAFDCMDKADQDAVTAAYVNIAKLIAAYEFELRSRHAPFDEFVTAGPDSTVISDEAKRGLRLFVGRASCVDCHGTPLLSDAGFHPNATTGVLAFATPGGHGYLGAHDIGVPQTGPGVPTVSDCPKGNPRCDCVTGNRCLPWGMRDGLDKLRDNHPAGSTLRANPFLRRGPHSDDQAGGAAAFAEIYAGMEAATQPPGTWRTPSLRDVELTGPYMHDGVYPTLEAVVAHYDRGGDGSGTPGGTKAPELRPLFLSAQDRSDLVAFLRTLTGRPDRPELHVPPIAATTASVPPGPTNGGAP